MISRRRIGYSGATTCWIPSPQELYCQIKMRLATQTASRRRNELITPPWVQWVSPVVNLLDGSKWQEVSMRFQRLIMKEIFVQILPLHRTELTATSTQTHRKTMKPQLKSRSSLK